MLPQNLQYNLWYITDQTHYYVPVCLLPSFGIPVGDVGVLVPGDPGGVARAAASLSTDFDLPSYLDNRSCDGCEGFRSCDVCLLTRLTSLAVASFFNFSSTSNN
jgi:hypothetical protein